jgi:TusA-related sulfurtransferase
MSKLIDCRGLACPKPVVLAKKEFESIESGEFTLLVDNDAARQNVQKFAESVGCISTVESRDTCLYGLHYSSILVKVQ